MRTVHKSWPATRLRGFQWKRFRNASQAQIVRYEDGNISIAFIHVALRAAPSATTNPDLSAVQPVARWVNDCRIRRATSQAGARFRVVLTRAAQPRGACQFDATPPLTAEYT